MEPGVDRQPTGAALESEPFVGRAFELGQLQGGLERAVSGAGVVFVVNGAAGVGKTALLRELLRRAREDNRVLSVVRGRCLDTYGSGEAYLPFLDGVGTLLLGRRRDTMLTLLRTYAPTWCQHFGPAVAGAAPADDLRDQTIGAGRERMMREMGDVFEVAAAEYPLICLAEDVQWADPSTLDLLGHLSSRLERQRVLIAITVRDEAISGKVRSCLQQILSLHCALKIALGPLAVEDVQAYVDQVFDPNELPPALAESCFRRTDGNPLFVKKLLAHLAERGDVSREGGRWRLAQPMSAVEQGVPDDVRSMVELRIRSLDPEDVRTLSAASVLGPEFASPILAGLLSADEMELEERLEQLVRRHGLLRNVGEDELPDGSPAMLYRFGHSIYQEVLYDGLVASRRRQLHRNAAREMERHHGASGARAAATQLAFHYEHGREFASAVRHLLRAGWAAARLHAFDEAESSVERSRNLLGKLREEERVEPSAEVHRLRGVIQIGSGRFDDAAATYAEMLAEARAAGRVPAECSALCGMCEAFFFGHRVEEMALAAYEASVAAARSGSEALRAEAQAEIALVMIADGGRLKDSIGLLDQALDTARRGDHAAALLRATTFRGFVHYWQSEYTQAAERLTEGQRLATSAGDSFWLLACKTFSGYALANLGRLSRAIATLETARSLPARDSERYWQPRIASALAFVYREIEDFATAVKLEDQAIRLARETGNAEAVASFLLGLALTHVRSGDLAAAGAALDELRQGGSDQRWLGWTHELRLQGALAEYHLAVGEAAAAVTHSERLLEAAERHGATGYVVVGRALAARAALGAGVRSTIRLHAREARERLCAGPAPLAGWRTLAWLAAAFAETGDDAEAEVCSREAAEQVVQVAAGIEEPALRETFLGSDAVRRLPRVVR